MGILPCPPAGAIAQLFGTAHGASEARELEDALPAHVAAKHQLLENEFDY